MSLETADEQPNLRTLLLGNNDRWDSGELARALKDGLSLSTIEGVPRAAQYVVARRGRTNSRDSSTLPF